MYAVYYLFALSNGLHGCCGNDNYLLCENCVRKICYIASQSVDKWWCKEQPKWILEAAQNNNTLTQVHSYIDHGKMNAIALTTNFQIVYLVLSTKSQYK